MINLFVDEKYEKLIRHAVNCVLLHFFIDEKDVDIEIGFLENEDMQQLNFASRGVNEVTDVLSFPAIEFNNNNEFLINNDEIQNIDNDSIEGKRDNKIFDVSKIKNEPFASINPENNALILGEIYICFDVAKKQALIYEHSIERELSFLTVHGVLHLLGFDHNNEEAENEMFSLQKEIMNAIGL